MKVTYTKRTKIIANIKRSNTVLCCHHQIFWTVHNCVCVFLSIQIAYVCVSFTQISSEMDLLNSTLLKKFEWCLSLWTVTRLWEVSDPFWHGTTITCTVCQCLQCPRRVQGCFHFCHLGLWLASYSYSSPFFSCIPLGLSSLNSQEVKHWRLFLSSRLITIVFEDVTSHLNTCYQLCYNDMLMHSIISTSLADYKLSAPPLNRVDYKNLKKFRVEVVIASWHCYEFHGETVA